MAGETVLIVEDHRESIVHLANNVLKPNGYKVITAMDGQRGLRRILADRPDVVILDLNMPKMDGLEVLAAMQEREVDIPVILTTFYGSEQVAKKAARLGAADYIVKPYKVSDMLRTVETALTGRRPAPAPLEAAEQEKAEEPEEMIPLTRQMQRWMRDMNILTQVGKALVAQLDVRRVCKRTIEAAVYITRANHAFLLLLNEGEKAKLCLCASRGPDDREVRLSQEPIESQLALRVVLSGQTTVQTEASGETDLEKVIGHTLGPVAAAPLRWQGKTLGVLVAARDPDATCFSEADVEWLGGLADYAAIAVRNAQLFEQSHWQPEVPPVDDRGIAALRRELDWLAAELQAVAERAQSMVGQLAADDEA